MNLLNAIRSRLNRRYRREAQLQRRWPAVLNLEVSRACNLRCRMCPRSAGVVADGSMDPALFERVAASAHRFRYVHLTGLGEPLLVRELPDFALRLKHEGCHVSFTTNATLLTPEFARAMLDARVDAVNVSCDAATAATYEATRGRGLFDRLVENVRALCALRDERGGLPYVQWVYVMMKSNLAELPDAVALAGTCGVNHFVAKHIETWLDAHGLDDALINTGRAPGLTTDEQRRFDETLSRAREAAARFPSLVFEAHPQFDTGETTCIARPLDSLFIDMNGNLCPCCYTLPINIRPYQTERALEEKSYVIGNVRDAPLEELLCSQRYWDFVGEFRAGRIPLACRGCLQLARRPPAAQRA